VTRRDKPTPIFQRYIFAPESFDQILLAVDNLDVAVWIEFRDITSREPPIVSTGSFRLFVVILVALCDCRSSDPELALWRIVRSEVASLGKIDKLFFNAYGYVAMSVHRPGKRIVYSAHAYRLSEAISCDNWGECHGHENLRVFGERSSAIHTKAEITSFCSANRAEDHAIDDSATGKACRQQGFLCG
jgi:hypothetical protein